MAQIFQYYIKFISMPQNLKSEPQDENKIKDLLNEDLQDSEHDKELMQSETFTIDMPDVKDIPGQENVVPLPLGELADTTISSDDEEGANIFDDEEEDKSDIDIVMGTEADVTSAERKDLRRTAEDMPTDDDNSLRAAALDNVDEEGVPLNEKGFGADVTGSELDVPGANEDDANEDIGEEDEENNQYSVDDNNDEEVN